MKRIRTFGRWWQPVLCLNRQSSAVRVFVLLIAQNSRRGCNSKYPIQCVVELGPLANK